MKLGPGTLSPILGSFLRRSGHSIWPIESLNERIRPSTEGSSLNVPTELFCRNGAVDQTLTSEAGRTYPRPPPNGRYCHGLPVSGLYRVMSPTGGSSL